MIGYIASLPNIDILCMSTMVIADNKTHAQPLRPTLLADIEQCALHPDLGILPMQPSIKSFNGLVRLALALPENTAHMELCDALLRLDVHCHLKHTLDRTDFAFTRSISASHDDTRGVVLDDLEMVGNLRPYRV